MDISAFLTPPEIMSARRALCIQPHPDDNEIGMGGIVAALAAKGCEIHYLTVTNGDLGAQGGPIDPAELAVLRRQETVAAGEALGVKVFHFLMSLTAPCRMCRPWQGRSRSWCGRSSLM